MSQLVTNNIRIVAFFHFKGRASCAYIDADPTKNKLSEYMGQLRVVTGCNLSDDCGMVFYYDAVTSMWLIADDLDGINVDRNLYTVIGERRHVRLYFRSEDGDYPYAFFLNLKRSNLRSAVEVVQHPSATESGSTPISSRIWALPYAPSPS
ncbi:hypothetical protein GGI20_004925 [Coemansia sp. BCRC 34301]|nr:hypothetical protein GGI20_004925 [Coemansia sp. BCRC 34301]